MPPKSNFGGWCCLVKKGFKYLIGLKDNGKVKPLCMMLLKKCGYTKSFNGTKYISFLIKDNELLKNITKCGIKSTILLKRIW